MLKRKILKRNGFTLLDAVITCVIIGIISVFALNSNSKSVDNARLSKAKAELATIEIAIRQYNLDYPTAKITSSTAPATAFNTLKSKGYLDVTPSYTSEYGCSYSFFTSTESNNLHVKLKNCKFTTGDITIF